MLTIKVKCHLALCQGTVRPEQAAPLGSEMEVCAAPLRSASGPPDAIYTTSSGTSQYHRQQPRPYKKHKRPQMTELRHSRLNCSYFDIDLATPNIP